VTSASFRAASPSLVTQETVGATVGVLVLVLVAAHEVGLGERPQVETFVLVFVSIVIEALPFVLLGAIASAALAVFVSDNAFSRVARLPLAVQLPAAALSAAAFPVCECGSVPVARRLIVRGVHPAAGLTFMLAAPIVNPIVLTSTMLAYGGGRHGAEVAFARAALGLAVAVTAGVLLGRGRVLRRVTVDHDHGHPARFGDHVARDFTFMGRFVVIGAAIGAALQTIVPQDALSQLAGTPIASQLALIGLAFALALCSEADAFVAASLTAFPMSSQLAFLVAGPVLDAKLTVLYGGTFRRSFVPRLALFAIPLIVAGSLVVGAALW
jgi:uncharacterized membrane protein YraQ (UPF0718 family)